MTDPHLSDRALVVRLRAGEEAAFEAFFSTYFPGLFRFALPRVGHDEDAAEDVVQAALSRAVTRLGTYRGEAALFTWLCTFCRHEISAYWRRRGDERQTPLVEDLPEVRAALDSLAASRDSGPEEELQRRELARRVQVTLDGLPPRYGDALEWKYVLGLSVPEIAARLGTSVKAAESLLTRARDAFRDGFTAVGSGLARET
jgi:RNA polymerase sigma-70 factor (ECF subfamily)